MERRRTVGEGRGRTANMTASGKRFIIYLSAEIGTEAKQKVALRRAGGEIGAGDGDTNGDVAVAASCGT